MPDSLSIDGFGPIPVRQPADAAEACAIVREASAVYPVGGGTALDIGLPPTKPGIVLDTTRLNAVIDYPARDMTITVKAGIRMAALQATLAAENQFLPVDVPFADEATLGGAVAANLSGPRRLGRGTFRDAVLGIRFITDEGIEVGGGGRVVKNVAGYDLMKLFTGSLGTLGVVTQLTLKVQPRSESSGVIVAGLSAAAVATTLDRLHVSTSRPAAVELLNAAAVKWLAADTKLRLPDADPWVLACGFEEKATTVGWQMRTLRDEWKGSPIRGICEFRDAATAPVWRGLTDLQAARPGWLTLKANVLPSATAAFATAAVAAHPDAAVHAHAGNGIVYVHLPIDPTPERAASVLAELSKLTRDGNANVVVRRCPPEWKAVLPVWGRDAGDRTLMRTVKATLDPRGIFNPGRVVS